MKILLILGRQPALGVAELESLFGSDRVTPVNGKAVTSSTAAAIVDVEPAEVDFRRLGGSIKACRLLTTLPTTEWRKIETYLIQNTPQHASLLPDGKLIIGISTYGLDVTPGTINATGLSIKKAIRKKTQKSVRLVPNNDLELSSAQVYHNRLTDERNWELVLVKDGDQTHLAQTFAVQDIDSYTRRDRERPKRDARVGMLPPKLAQIIINLAVSDTQPSRETTVLDPFCGTGVVLQEASLMGFNSYGTDLEQRMIDYSKANLDWLATKYDLPDFLPAFQKGDATSHTWTQSPPFVAGETYLGKPFTSKPTPEVLAQTISEVDLILKKFLKNIHMQLQPGARFCLAVPAWQIAPNQFKHLPLVDQIDEMGYNRVSFEHVRDEQLLYYREDQIVARQLIVITRD